MARVQKRRPTSPGILAALRARKIAVAALYWGPIIFLLSTIVLVVSLWKGINLGGLQYLAVLLLAAGGGAPAWTLQRRPAGVSPPLGAGQRTPPAGPVPARLRASAESPRVDADPFAFRQLLLTLLLNALDFARTRISISTNRTREGRAEVVVADDGPGVSQENRERIFQRFVTTRPGGNGLGLSTSRDIARAHGGTLTLRDGSSGATFVLTLPPA